MDTFDGSDVMDSSDATLATVVENTKRINLDDTAGSEELSSIINNQGAVGLSDMSDGHMSETSETAVNAAEPNFPAVTKVYYHIDDEPTPYMTEVHLSPDLITLGDVKRVLTRSNFKYFAKTIDPDSGSEVKMEIRDDMQRLQRTANGRFELFLMTTEGSTTSDGSSGLPKSVRHQMVPGPAPSGRYGQQMYRPPPHHFDSSMMSTDSESMFSAPAHYMKGSLGRRPMYPPQYMSSHRGRRFEDSTLGSESDARVFSDEDDRDDSALRLERHCSRHSFPARPAMSGYSAEDDDVEGSDGKAYYSTTSNSSDYYCAVKHKGSTTTDITSVSRQHVNAYRRRQKRKNYRKPSRASSFSSITESSMSLDVITVTLNMDPVNFLGISIVGESSTRGDNGIYVANIIKGGAVALDGRIEAGDMILQVNEISFENFTNDQAVDVLREAVARKGPIKLTVAKSFNQGPKSCFTMPRNHRDEPVRPIDTQAWIAHTNAMLNRGMPSILEGSEGAPTPVPGDWPHGRPPSSSTVTSGGSNGQTAVPTKLNVNSDKKKIIQAMVMPDSGLEIKDRHWLKLLVPNSMIGTELLDWLLENVDGLRDKKEAKKFATDLLKLKLITQMHANQQTFIEQRYYMVGPECQDFLRYRTHPEEFQQPSCSNRWQQRWSGGMPKSQAPASMVSGYASMPVSPFPHMIPRPGGPDVRSQTSGGSGEGSGSGSDHKRRQVLLPPAPPSSANLPARLDEFPMEMAASRQSFRQAMSHPLHSEFFIDHL